MKKMMKRLVSFVVALAMIATVIPVVNAEAATTKKMTLYVGEAVYFTDYGKVSSVTSSKKSVVSAAKDKENNTHANLKAKKAGTSTVTVKTKYGTTKIKVTVKKLAFDVKLTHLSEGSVLVSVKNNTKQAFDYANVTYTLKGADGEVLEKDKKLISDLLPGKTSYTTISYSSYSFTIDINQCSGKISDVSRSLSATYKDRSSKVAITDTEDTQINPGYSTITLKMENKSSSSVSGSVFILLYDEADQLIGVRPVSIYLKGNAVETETIKIDTEYTYKSYDHYKLKTVAYSKSY